MPGPSSQPPLLLPLLTPPPQYKAAEVGLKLTAGFEMVCANRARFGQADSDGEEQQPQGAGEPAAGCEGAPNGAAASEAALAGDPGWAAFRAALERRGYFRGSLPGSAQHSQLLADALGSYWASEAYRRGTAALAAPALRIDQLLRQAAGPASFPPPEELPPEGSEAWLHEQAPAQLEAELAARAAELEAQQARRHARQAQRQQAQPGGGGGAEGRSRAGRSSVPCSEAAVHGQQASHATCATAHACAPAAAVAAPPGSGG